MSEKFYITTSIMYANGAPHVGFAFELILADMIARYQRLSGKETFFLTGIDEHGSSVAKAAEKRNTEPQAFVDEISQSVQNLIKILNISNNDFIRTTDQKKHWPTAQRIWNILADKGDLYKKKYKGLYCVGHESFIKKTDLVDGLCPLHQTAPEEIEEENYFLKITKYKKEIKEKIEKDEIKIVPESRKKEILNMVEDAEDVSVSRPSSVLKWGIPIPGDDTQTMWVWVDALSNYLYPEKFWPADIHLIGKDIIRFHALIWTTILLSAELPLPKSIFIHGFINVDGQKMSKTIGNVIDPFIMAEKYGTEVLRYFLLREIPSGEDGDFSEEKLKQRYQSDLANGLGNLVQRVLTLIENNLNGEVDYLKRFEKAEVTEFIKKTEEKYRHHIEEFRLHEALGDIFELIGFANAYTNEHKPWELAKDNLDHFLEVMINLTLLIATTAFWIYPFMPETGEKILGSFGLSLQDKVEELDHKKLVIKKGEGLFPRLS